MDRIVRFGPVTTRRGLLKGGMALAGLAALGTGPASLLRAASAQSRTAQMALQLGWFANAQMAGDFTAMGKGFFKDVDIDVRIVPGGPSIDPVGVVASGSVPIGNVASIGVLLVGRSRGVPLKAFATAFQRHPFAFFFLRGSGIKTPADFVGKNIGIQGTARPLLDAVLAKYKVPRTYEFVGAPLRGDDGKVRRSALRAERAAPSRVMWGQPGTGDTTREARS